MVSCDIIKLLSDKLMSNVIRSIFTQLDDESLRQAELVSKVWWEIISEECIWKFVLRNKILATPLWKKFVHLKDTKWKIGPLGQNNHSYYKNIYIIIEKEIENLGRNWDRGNCTFRNIDCGLEGPFLKLSDKYLATGEDFIIKLWNRTTWNCDKVFQGHENHVECVHFDHNFLISSSWDKTIRVWNLETTELLNTVRDSSGVVHALKLENGYLVCLSTDMDTDEYSSCLTVRHMSSPQNIITGHSVHLNRFCYGMDFNEKYIVVPVRDPLEDDTTDDIQIYSLSTLEVVRTIKIRSPFNGKTWHLLRNLIIMGSPDETISFWDVETGECKRTIKEDGEVSCCGFNEKYLVTGSIRGRLKIWDFQALIDFEKADSHPFLLRTIKNTEETVFSAVVDDFQIVGTSVIDDVSQVVVWDFLPSTT